MEQAHAFRFPVLWLAQVATCAYVRGLGVKNLQLWVTCPVCSVSFLGAFCPYPVCSAAFLGVFRPYPVCSASLLGAFRPYPVCSTSFLGANYLPLSGLQHVVYWCSLPVLFAACRSLVLGALCPCPVCSVSFLGALCPYTVCSVHDSTASP